MKTATARAAPTDAWSRQKDVLGGALVFSGTRVPVRSLFDHVEAGDSLDDFLEGFPSVSRPQAMAALEECWRLADHEATA